MIPKIIAKIKGWIQPKINKAKDRWTIWWWTKRPPKPKPEVADRYCALKLPEKAAAMISNLGYNPASAEAKFMSGNPKLLDFNPFEVAEFLVQCGHIQIMTILKLLFENSDDFPGKGPPPAKIKTQIIMNLWLTKPPFEEHMEKILKVANMVAHPTVADMLGLCFEKWPLDTKVLFLEKVNPAPPLAMTLEKKMPIPAAVPVFMALKKKNMDRFKVLTGMLPNEYKGNLMKEIGAKEGQAKEGEKKAKQWAREENRMHIEKTFADILDSLKDKIVPPPPSNPEGGPDGEAGKKEG